MHRNSLVLALLICLSLSASTRAQYACTPGDFPPLSDPVELDIIETQPFPGTTMVPGMQVISAGGAVALMTEPSGESDQYGELDTGVSRQILGIATDEQGEIWYMLRGNEEAYRVDWCRGNTLIPDPGHITDVSYLVWLASGLASNGQITMAHKLIANFAGIGVISEEEDNVLIAVYYPGNPVIECEDMFWHQDCTVLFAGEWGFSFYNIFNMASMHEISPSGKYYAIGADGTGIWRGTIDLVDLETGVKYRYNIPRSGVYSYSDWIEGDFLLIQSVDPGPMFENWTGFGNQPWLNYSFRTESEGSPRNVVLMHGNRAWMILPEDRYYNYRLNNNYGVYENGIFFDVAASPNVIPSLAGIESYDDFTDWIDSMGGQDAAFPSFDFRIYIDTLNMSVSFINDSTLSSEAEEEYPDSIIAIIDLDLNATEICSLPSGEYLYVANGRDNCVTVIRTSDNSIVATIDVGKVPSNLCALPSGDYVYVVNWSDGNISVIRTSDNSVIATIDVGVKPSGICSVPSGNYLYVANSQDNNVSVIRTSDNSVVTNINTGDYPKSICSHPSGDYIYVTNMLDHSISMIRTSDNSVVETISVSQSPKSICSLPSGDYLYVANGRDDNVSVIRLLDDSIVATINVGDDPVSICSLPSGSYVYTANWLGNSISVIRTSDNSVVATMDLGGVPSDICSVPSGDFVYVTNWSKNTVLVLN